MTVVGALGASVVGLCTTALFLLFYSIRPLDADKAKERRLLTLKKIRIGSFVIVAVGQACIGTWRAIRGKFMLAMYDTQLVATGILWALTAVAMMIVWRRQAGVSLLPVVLVSLAVVGLQMATDCLHDPTRDFPHDDRIVGISLHTVELGVMLFVCMAEALYGHMASLPQSELEEPLFDKTEKEKTKEAEKRAAKGRPSTTRAQRTARAFRYVWPESRPLRLRLVACFLLVLGERCVNLAVPVLYKHMVDQLSGAASAEAAGGGSGQLELVARAMVKAAMAAAGVGTGSGGGSGSGSSGGVEGQGPLDVEAQGRLLGLAYGLLKAAQHLSFWSVFYPWVFAYLGFYFLRGGSGMEGLLANMRDLVWIPITQAAFRRISLDVFGHLLDLDHAFHLHRKTGQIMRILDRGTSSIQDTVSIVLFNVVPQLIDIVVACTYLALRMQPWAAVIVFITVASYVPLTVIITERRGVIRKRMNALDNAREGRATDMLLNYETVKYFCNEKFELAGYDNATRQYQAAEYWQMAFLAMLSITQASVVWFGLAAGMVVCVRGVVRGSLTVGDAVLFVTMMNQLYVPLTFFGSYYRQVQKALVDMENMFELLDTEPSVQDFPEAAPLAVTNAQLDFDNVVFGYNPTSPPVLKGVSFTVPGGKTLAVVGATGSGKSTILRLLLRFYDPQSGRVLLDGQDVRCVTQESLRRAVAVVPQDTVMFNDTVLYNIRYGRTDATDEEVTEAAAVAHIHNSIATSFKKGYATRVGERGLRLSGGEKQRVAFARAVLKRPSVLILDEATSALDSLTELAIQSSLQTLRSRCTTVIVAHRLSTIMDADLILVLDHGEVSQCGSHSELMEEGGLYAAMWTRQQDTAGYTTPIIGISSGGAASLPAGLTGHRTLLEPMVPGLAAAAPPSERLGHPPAATAGPTSTNATAPSHGLPPAPRGPSGSPLPPHPSYVGGVRLSPGHGYGFGLGLGAGASRDSQVSPAGLSRVVGATGSGSSGGGGLPRVPSRLMRRAFLNEEMSEEVGEQGAVSRNPTPRRSRGMVEDEADERLYEDRETEDPPDTPARGFVVVSPDRAAANGAKGGNRPGDRSPSSAAAAAAAGGAAKGGYEVLNRQSLPLSVPAAAAAVLAAAGARAAKDQGSVDGAGSQPASDGTTARQPAVLDWGVDGGGGGGGGEPRPQTSSAFATPEAAAAVLGTQAGLTPARTVFGSPLTPSDGGVLSPPATPLPFLDLDPEPASPGNKNPGNAATAAAAVNTVARARRSSNKAGNGGGSRGGSGAVSPQPAGSPAASSSRASSLTPSSTSVGLGGNWEGEGQGDLLPGRALLGVPEQHQERRRVQSREQGKGRDGAAGSPTATAPNNSGLRGGRRRPGSGSDSPSAVEAPCGRSSCVAGSGPHSPPLASDGISRGRGGGGDGSGGATVVQPGSHRHGVATPPEDAL